MTCPSLTDLLDPNPTRVVQDHLRNCVRCRAIVAIGEPSTSDIEPTTNTTANVVAPAELAPTRGAIWAFWAPRYEEYLVAAVLSADATSIAIAPLLLDTRWATDADIILSQEDVGYEALVPVWADNEVLAEQAAEPLGMLSEQCLDQLSEAYDASRSGRALPNPGGPAVISEADPRIQARAAMSDDLRPIFEPWLALQGSDELGPVMATRREHNALTIENLAEVAGVEPRAWAAFEAGQSSPHDALPVIGLSRAIRHLSLMESERVVQLAHNSVFRHHLDNVHTQPAQARRRRGVAPVPKRDDDRARATAEIYAAALRKAMKQ